MQHVPPRPPGWGDDPFTEYLDNVRSNQYAAFLRRNVMVNILQELDACFLAALVDRIPTTAAAQSLLLFRSHSSFRASAAAAMCGQMELFALSRVVLECAGYALHLTDAPDTELAWWRRHEGEKERAKSRDEFSMRKIRRSIAARDRRLNQIFGALYERTIDFGAHPNVRGVMSNLKRNPSPRDDGSGYDKIYLHAGDTAFGHGLKFARQAGLCALRLGQLIFAEDFAPIASRLDSLQSRL